MASKNCAACDDLRQDAPLFVINGLGDTECTSLQNDTGLNPSSGNDDFTDLTNMNDCLVGNMAEEIDSYSSCDWKDYEKRFVPNVWTVFKGIICSIKGIWTNIYNLWKLAEKLDCIVTYMNKGATFHIGEDETDGSYVVAGKGCSFLGPVAGDDHAADLYIRYVAGGLGNISCSLDFHQNNFTDEGYCWNFDNNGVNPQRTKSRNGNSEWGETGKPAEAGELVFELRIKKSQYPQLSMLYRGCGQASMGSAFFASFLVFNEGTWAYGQHGACHSANHSAPGTPQRDGYSYGHQVPEGWIYVQCRIDYIALAMHDGAQYSPYGWIGVRLNPTEIDC